VFEFRSMVILSMSHLIRWQIRGIPSSPQGSDQLHGGCISSL
jgi:hypothetical protein